MRKEKWKGKENQSSHFMTMEQEKNKQRKKNAFDGFIILEILLIFFYDNISHVCVCGHVCPPYETHVRIENLL